MAYTSCSVHIPNLHTYPIPPLRSSGPVSMLDILLLFRCQDVVKLGGEVGGQVIFRTHFRFYKNISAYTTSGSDPILHTSTGSTPGIWG